MPSTRILVAVSTPWASEKLFTTVRDLADRLHATVIVAHVAKASEHDESDEEARLRAQQTLTSLTAKLAESNVPAEGLLLYGSDIARAILNATEAQHATLIVLGQTAKGRFARLLAGDVPSQVVRSAAVPVLLCPPEWSGPI
jgi:nucleotide-binding universal stress UspA family protein